MTWEIMPPLAVPAAAVIVGDFVLAWLFHPHMTERAIQSPQKQHPGYQRPDLLSQVKHIKLHLNAHIALIALTHLCTDRLATGRQTSHRAA